MIDNLRKIKDKDEIKKIQKAAEIIDKTFYLILKIIKPGLSERFIKRKIIEIMEDLGADGVSFPPIIASGRGSVDPHHQTSNKKIKSGEALLIDMGAKYKGYCSDLTRTIFVGKASSKFKKLYNFVLKIQKEAIKKCKEDYSIRNLHKEAVFSFQKYKQDKYFVHGLGHGVGIDIHEFPSIHTKGEGKFKKGMIITIEPGLYYKNFGGVRIEDLCLINNGCKVLSKAAKKLIEIKI